MVLTLSAPRRRRADRARPRDLATLDAIALAIEDDEIGAFAPDH